MEEEFSVRRNVEEREVEDRGSKDGIKEWMLILDGRKVEERLKRWRMSLLSDVTNAEEILKKEWRKSLVFITWKKRRRD